MELVRYLYFSNFCIGSLHNTEFKVLINLSLQGTLFSLFQRKVTYKIVPLLIGIRYVIH